MSITKDAVFFGSSILVLIITIVIATINLIATRDMHEDSSDRAKVMTAGILASLVSGGIIIGMIAYFVMEREYPSSKKSFVSPPSPPGIIIGSNY